MQLLKALLQKDPHKRPSSKKSFISLWTLAKPDVRTSSAAKAAYQAVEEWDPREKDTARASVRTALAPPGMETSMKVLRTSSQDGAKSGNEATQAAGTAVTAPTPDRSDKSVPVPEISKTSKEATPEASVELQPKPPSAPKSSGSFSWVPRFWGKSSSGKDKDDGETSQGMRWGEMPQTVLSHFGVNGDPHEFRKCNESAERQKHSQIHSLRLLKKRIWLQHAFDVSCKLWSKFWDPIVATTAPGAFASFVDRDELHLCQFGQAFWRFPISTPGQQHQYQTCSWMVHWTKDLQNHSRKFWHPKAFKTKVVRLMTWQCQHNCWVSDLPKCWRFMNMRSLGQFFCGGGSRILAHVGSPVVHWGIVNMVFVCFRCARDTTTTWSFFDTN